MSTLFPIFLTLMTISVFQSCSFLINMLYYKTKDPKPPSTLNKLTTNEIFVSCLNTVIFNHYSHRSNTAQILLSLIVNSFAFYGYSMRSPSVDAGYDDYPVSRLWPEMKYLYCLFQMKRVPGTADLGSPYCWLFSIIIILTRPVLVVFNTWSLK